MNKYTVLGKKVDKMIDGHMRIIVEELKKILGDNLVSVVLFGGFARGEGSVLVKRRKVTPLNDYDVMVVTKAGVEDKVLQKLSLDLNKKFGVESRFSFEKALPPPTFYTDFKNFIWDELPRLPAVMKYYELRHSGRVLWGKDALGQIPEYKLDQLPIMDGLRDLFNRVSLLVECFWTKYFKKMSEDEKVLVIWNVSKCYLAACEALLILSGRFVCSYRKRAKIFAKYYRRDFPELAKELPNLAKDIDYFTRFKLEPHFDQEKALDWWFKTRDETLMVIRYFLQKVLGAKVKDNSDLAERVRGLGFIFLEPYISLYLKARAPVLDRRFLRRIFYPLAVLRFNVAYFRQVSKAGKFYPEIILSRVDPNLRIFGAVPIVLGAISKRGEVDFAALKRVCKELSGIYPLPKGIVFKNRQDLGRVFKFYADVYRVYQFVKV